MCQRSFKFFTWPNMIIYNKYSAKAAKQIETLQKGSQVSGCRLKSKLSITFPRAEYGLGLVWALGRLRDMYAMSL